MFKSKIYQKLILVSIFNNHMKKLYFYIERIKQYCFNLVSLAFDNFADKAKLIGFFMI